MASSASRVSLLFLNRGIPRLQRFPLRPSRCCLSGGTIVDNEKDVSENATRRLLDTPIWDPSMRQLAQQTIRWWTTPSKNNDGDNNNNNNNDDESRSAFSNTWALFLRLAETNDYTLDEKLFHQILHLWDKRISVTSKPASANSDDSKDIPSPQDMLALVQEYSSRGILQPTDMTYNIILNALQPTAHLDKEIPEFADGVLDEMVTNQDFPNPSMVTFAIVLNIWASSSHPQRILRVQMLEKKRKELEADNRLPDWKQQALIYKSTLINVYAKAHRPHDCEAIWNEWWQDWQEDNDSIERPNIQVATTILSGWGAHPSRAEAFLRRLIVMHRQGMLEEPPNVFSYTVVLDAWAKSDMKNGAERAHAILLELQNDDQLEPNVVSYTSVISGYIKRRNHEKAHLLLNEMVNAGFTPNTMTFNAIIQGAKGLGQARQLLRHMRYLARWENADCAPDVASYTAVIRLCARLGDSLAAEQVWEEMIKDNFVPDSIAYNNLLNAYAKSKLPVKAQAVLDEMVRNFLSKQNETAARPETISFNTVISAWSDCMNVRKAQAVFQELKNLQPKIEGLQPNVITYTILLNCFSKAVADEEEVIALVGSLFQEMEDSEDVEPNLVSYATLCNCFARFGQGEAAVAVLSRMRTKGIEPNGAVYAQVLHALAEQCVRYPDELVAFDSIEDTLREMIEVGVVPTVPMFSAWLKAIKASSKISDKGRWATKIVGTMKNFGLKPNEVILRQVEAIQKMDPAA